MKVNFHLRRLERAQPVTALLCPGHDTTALVAMLSRLRLDMLPPIFSTAAGFVLKFAEPLDLHVPGVIRLRARCENLLIPADAELLPTLLDDEAAALVKHRGLLFLPGGRILAFEPAQPLALSALVAVDVLDRTPWTPLPEVRHRASKLTAIMLAASETPPESTLDAGGQGIGTESPRPDDAGLGSRALGQVQESVGRGLMGLGQMLGIQSLARMGAKLIEGAVTRVPRLTESLLGMQEAALRALLKEFREGDMDKALRRALPLGHDADRGTGNVSGNARLPFHNLIYSLQSLLGGVGSGGAAVWLGGYDVQQELTREYQKAAEEAVRKGDYRRAAYIYGKLLRDYRLAANVLSRGGLHHDAARIYLSKCGDHLAAAQEYVSAGDFDRAIELYRQTDRRVLAGDLLTRLGELDEALLEYQVAAERMIKSHGNYLGAGELILSKTGRVDLARAHFQSGWAGRPNSGHVNCGLRLAKLHADSRDYPALRQLLQEADAVYRPPGNEAAAAPFYNEIVRLAEREDLAALRDDLRDYALQGLAAKLRTRIETQDRGDDAVSRLFGQHGTWAAPVLRDAEHAWRGAMKKPQPPPSTPTAVTSLRVGRGTVAAASYAPGSGQVFLGFEDGALACCWPERSGTIYLPFDPSVPRGNPVLGFSVEASGRWLGVLRNGPRSDSTLTFYERDSSGDYHICGNLGWETESASWVTPMIRCRDSDYLLGWGNSEELKLVRGLHFHGTVSLSQPFPTESFVRGLVFDRSNGGAFRAHLLVISAACSMYRGTLELGSAMRWDSRGARGAQLNWRPHVTELDVPLDTPLAWMEVSPGRLELAGLGEHGTAYWSALNTEPKLEVVSTNVAVRADQYLAVTIVRPGLVAAVARKSIDWLRPGARDFQLLTSSKTYLSNAVACFPSHVTHELIVVCRDGVVVRVPVPR